VFASLGLVVHPLGEQPNSPPDKLTPLKRGLEPPDEATGEEVPATPDDDLGVEEEAPTGEEDLGEEEEDLAEGEVEEEAPPQKLTAEFVTSLGWRQPAQYWLSADVPPQTRPEQQPLVVPPPQQPIFPELAVPEGQIDPPAP